MAAVVPVTRVAVDRAAEPRQDVAPPAIKLVANKVSVYYGPKHALQEVSMEIGANRVTALIGPSGCGKSTFLRTMNRMNDLVPDAKVRGELLLDGQNLYGSGVDVVRLRRRVGMVFQRSNPFP